MRRAAAIAVAETDGGLPVVELLAQRFTYLDRRAWEKEIFQGRIWVNGRSVSPGMPLSEGDRLEYLPPDMAEPAVETGCRKVYEDAGIMVVDKPANLPCHPSGRYFRHTLWALLKASEGLETVRFVNRLDRETSGLVLIAKTRAAAKHYGDQFASGETMKRYLVLVEGLFPQQEMVTRGYLMADLRSPVKKKRRFCAEGTRSLDREGEFCETVFRGIRHRDGLSLVEAIPQTGRLHQIRATLVELGYPVVGDKIYGPDDTLFIRFIEDRLTGSDRIQLRLPRQALHAAGLAIRPPSPAASLIFDAPIPPDMANLIG